MDIEIRPKSVFTGLLLIILFLMLANVFAIVLMFKGGSPTLINLFYLDNESNIPSFYSASALLFSSILLALITIVHKRLGTASWYWLGLALLFLFLSLDEIAAIHEKLVKPARNFLHTSGAFYFAWVIPYSIGFLILLASYFRFLLNLPNRTRVLFITSGAIYILGALVFEMIGGQVFENSNHQISLAYATSTTVEELFEMLGVALFVYALLLYIAQELNKVTITISNGQKSLNAKQ